MNKADANETENKENNKRPNVMMLATLPINYCAMETKRMLNKKRQKREDDIT